MIRVHLAPHISATPTNFAACDGWEHDEATGTLNVHNGSEVMATFAPGTWVYVEDLGADPNAEVPA